MKHNHSRTVRRSIGIAAAGVAAGLAACATTAPPRVTTDAGTPGAEPVSPATARLAEQARRDVEQLTGIDPGVTPARRTAIEWRIPAVAAAEPKTPGIVLASDRPKPPRPVPAPVTDEEPGGATVARDPDGNAETDRLRHLIVELSAELYRRGAYSDMPLPELLLIAATTIVTPDRALATEALPGLTDRERELLREMQTFFTRLGRELAADGDPEILVREIDTLHRALATQPTLTINRAALCTRVDGFGDFTEFPPNGDGRYAFLAHRDQEAVVYVEIEDFTSELNAKGQWVTELSQQLIIYSDRDGIPVWREDWQAGVDLSRNRRADFFIVQVITLPPQLSVGRYHLKIRIRDVKSEAEADAAIDFEMVADSRMTGQR